MALKISSVRSIKQSENKIYLLNDIKQIKSAKIATDNVKYLTKNLSEKNDCIALNQAGVHSFFVYVKQDKKNTNSYFEKLRQKGAAITQQLNKCKLSNVGLISLTKEKNSAYHFIEGLSLANYQFLKYKNEKKTLAHSFSKLNVSTESITAKQITELKNILDAVYHARNLVNEPLSYLTATQLSKEFIKIGKSAGLKVEVFNKKKIQSLKMGGLLAVNLGSIDPPTFTILEWKPKNAKNKKPIVLVGKGVVYDTGGLSLKPTPNGMDHMKCDMGGAAAVGCAMYAIAKNKLPLHVVCLIPATDNRPGLNAYVPGDVIKMHSGATVEVLNTDAEGRMLLADALSYAKKYKPQLVMDAATLTGSAVRAIGQKGVVVMGNADEKTKKLINESGYAVHERTAEMPFWDDYKDLLKSEVADIKNIGGPFAGCITAGKFLEHFTDYPYMHFDIAPGAWFYANDHYRLKNGTGMGVRLFYEIAKRLAK